MRSSLLDSDDEDDFETESQEMVGDVPEVEPPPIRLCNMEVNLRGPFSPLETTLYSVMRSGITKTIAVDPLSVNSIMLDNDLHVRLTSTLINSKNEKMCIYPDCRIRRTNMSLRPPSIKEIRRPGI